MRTMSVNIEYEAQEKR